MCEPSMVSSPSLPKNNGKVLAPFAGQEQRRK